MSNLSRSSLLRYLIARDVIAEEAALDPLFITEASSRHRNFMVLQEAGDGFFVKQGRSSDPSSPSCVRTEALVYWLAHNHSAGAAIQKYVPTYVHYDPDVSTLVTRLVRPSRTAHEVHTAQAQDAPALAQRAGALLRRSHDATRALASSQEMRPWFASQPPWILGMHQVSDAWFSQHGAGNARVAAMIRATPTLVEALQRATSSWQAVCLVHGDMKLSNLLIPGERDDPVIIDWEYAQWGDPAWDVGGLLQSYLSLWALAAATNGVQDAGYRPECIIPAIHAFWGAYAGAGGVLYPDFLARATSLGALRMLQTALEVQVGLPEVTPGARALCNLAVTISRDPAAFLRKLGFGQVH
jgi:hypothetical protein